MNERIQDTIETIEQLVSEIKDYTRCEIGTHDGDEMKKKIRCDLMIELINHCENTLEDLVEEIEEFRNH